MFLNYIMDKKKESWKPALNARIRRHKKRTTAGPARRRRQERQERWASTRFPARDIVPPVVFPPFRSKWATRWDGTESWAPKGLPQTNPWGTPQGWNGPTPWNVPLSFPWAQRWRRVQAPGIEERHGQLPWDHSSHGEGAQRYMVGGGFYQRPNQLAHADTGGKAPKSLKTQAGEFAVKKGKEYAKKVWSDCMKTSSSRTECLKKAKNIWRRFGISAQQGLNWVIGADPKTGAVNCRTSGGYYKYWNPYCLGKKAGFADFGGTHSGHSHRHKITQPELFLYSRRVSHDNVKWEGQ